MARAFAVAGSEAEWDSGPIERVLECLNPALQYIGMGDDVPSPYDVSDDAVEFWEMRL